MYLANKSSTKEKVIQTREKNFWKNALKNYYSRAEGEENACFSVSEERQVEPGIDRTSTNCPG